MIYLGKAKQPSAKNNNLSLCALGRNSRAPVGEFGRLRFLCIEGTSGRVLKSLFTEFRFFGPRCLAVFCIHLSTPFQT